MSSVDWISGLASDEPSWESALLTETPFESPGVGSLVVSAGCSSSGPVVPGVDARPSVGSGACGSPSAWLGWLAAGRWVADSSGSVTTTPLATEGRLWQVPRC